jgi:hypothetical protein
MLHGAAHWKATIHIFKQKKFQKFQKIECIHSGLPKTAKSHFGCLGPLGVNTNGGVAFKFLISVIEI